MGSKEDNGSWYHQRLIRIKTSADLPTTALEPTSPDDNIVSKGKSCGCGGGSVSKVFAVHAGKPKMNTLVIPAPGAGVSGTC